MTVEDIVYNLERLIPYIIDFLIRLGGALLILLIGYIIALMIKGLVVKVANVFKIDQGLTKTGWTENFQKAGITMTGSQILGSTAKWMLIFVAFMLAIGHLEWMKLYDLLYKIVLFLPNIFIAIVVLLFALIISNIIEKIVSVKAQKAAIIHYSFLASLVKWIFLVFIFIIILTELRIGEDIFPLLIQSLTTGITIAIALAIGLSFGLGGKEAAARFLEKFRK